MTTTTCLLCGYFSYCLDTFSFPWMTFFIFIGSFAIFLLIELVYNLTPIAYAIEFMAFEYQFMNPTFYLAGIIILMLLFLYLSLIIQSFLSSLCLCCQSFCMLLFKILSILILSLAKGSKIAMLKRKERKLRQTSSNLEKVLASNKSILLMYAAFRR